jgi:hypothetical protein
MHQLKPPMDDKFVELWEKFKKSVKDGINIEVSSVRNINKLEQQRQKSDKILNELIKNYYIGNNETNFRIFMYETVKKESLFRCYLCNNFLLIHLIFYLIFVFFNFLIIFNNFIHQYFIFLS